MLARHLLFLATRRPNQALLAIQQQPSEQVSTAPCPPSSQQQHQHQQPNAPPPYVGPPQVSHSLHDEYQAAAYERRGQRQHPHNQFRQNMPVTNNNNQHHHHQPPPHGQQQQHILEPYQRFIHDKRNLQYLAYADNQNIYGPQPSSQQQQQQFFTLPNRRAQRDVVLEPPRSITPDIISSRPRPHAPLSSMHMLARQGQQAGSPDKFYHQQQQDSNRRRFEQQHQQQQQQQQRQAPLDVRNRFASPVGLSAVGYRLFASPIQDCSPRSVPISPIGPEQANGFRSSTPSTLAERLALHSQRCASPKPTQQPDSSIILSPIKTTMSNEELFAAIHKSKRRLNIRDEPESLSPAGSLGSLASQTQHVVAGTRHSWSPESHKVPEIPKSVPASVAATSRMDFKRLLLQQSIKSGPIRVSAAEQLKLSRQQCQEQQQLQQQAPPPQQQPLTPTKSSTSSQQLAKVLSPRSAWRFQTPRTDVLSSTIIEDAAAEEKAMKPSPEALPIQSDIPATRQQHPSLHSRRQLDLGRCPETTNIEQLKNRINDTKSKSQQRSLEKREKELENRLQLIDSKVSQANVEEDPVKAIENRRISNQLARAQFLASSAPAPAPSRDLFSKRFRARSESPQQNNPQRTKASGGVAGNDNANAENPVVTRSPSAPALETAL